MRWIIFRAEKLLKDGDPIRPVTHDDYRLLLEMRNELIEDFIQAHNIVLERYHHLKVQFDISDQQVDSLLGEVDNQHKQLKALVQLNRLATEEIKVQKQKHRTKVLRIRELEQERDIYTSYIRDLKRELRAKE